MEKIGIIGGSGLGKLSLFEESHTETVNTPYGAPSSSLLSGKIENKDVIIISRHGREHTIPPSHVNYRANIYALKQAGCNHILATSACGSLKEEYRMGDFVILDQFIDFTKFRKNTFFDVFEPGMPVHTPMGKPFNETLRRIFIEICKSENITHHTTGTAVSIEGPRFSTKAESFMFRGFGADVINMTIATECTLANEMQIPYATLALVTDYDCWRENSEEVSWETVLENFNKSMPVMTDILYKAILKI